ncbi:sigma-70 family RNA polymerase sigma factor [Brevibacterium sp.]|uniref:RNA polymerase sigma factor n=1 Tax=Brevibacterium sp. TaxID=1701 RepID=UPI0028116B1C|nr:sigma-70 family RNA polymerase sigma factor [Brevibacterium sp.]
MTIVDNVSADVGGVVNDDEWFRHLGDQDPAGSAAQRTLHDMLVRATRTQVWRLRSQLPGAGPTDLEDLAQQAADDALLAVLRKLDTFEGRSRFSTWVYKFGVLHAGAAVRRQAWRHREVMLSDSLPVVDHDHLPSEVAEGDDLVRAVRRAIESALTPHQRRIMLALLVEQVPIDVLAERLGTTRNSLYKTVHDARQRLRHALIVTGHLEPQSGRRTS